MDKRRNSSLVGRCGIYCGACSIFLATTEGGDLKKAVSKSLGIPEDKIACQGCGELLARRSLRVCEILRCLESKEQQYCYECDQYHADDCERFEKIYRSHLERDGFDLRQSLQRLESTTVEKWLEENAKKWICQSCGAQIYLGLSRCHRCGNPLW